MQSTSAGYQTEEAKSGSATPQVYVAMMRTNRSIVSADYAGGVHTNTEFVGSELRLQPGKTSGNWVSAVIDSGHLTPNIIFDKISWTETLNGGTVTVQIRTAATSGGVASATYVTYVNGTIYHVERYRYYQLKVSLVGVEVDTNQGLVLISTKDGQALINDAGQDFTSYAGDGSSNEYSIVVKDVGEDEATGYLGAEGTGITYGAETHDDSNAAADPNSSEADAITGWAADPTGGTVTSVSTDPNVGSYHFRVQAGVAWEGILAASGTTPTVAGKLYIITYDIKVISGRWQARVRDSGDANTIESLETNITVASWTSKTSYWTAVGTNERINILCDSGAGEAYIDNISIKEILTVPANTGIKIYSTQNGSTQNFTSVSGSFNPNESLTYSVYSSPTISSLVVRHKALLPKGSYTNLGTFNYGVNTDFNESFCGDMTFELDNKSHQWRKYQSDSYIYGIDYRLKLIEVWAGFSVSGTTEWLLQYLGEIQKIDVDSGVNASYNAKMTTLDYLHTLLTKTMLGKPSSTGTPQPYMSGKRYRVLCKETNTFVYSFYCEQTITSIDAVYIRDTNIQKWITAPENTTSAINKTVTFTTDPGTEVAVDITVDSNEHPIETIYDIIQNKLSLSSDYYNSTILDLIKSRTSGLEVGVNFEMISVFDAFKELGKILDCGFYIENGQIKFNHYWPMVTTTQTFTEDHHKNVAIRETINEVQNKVSCFFGNYDDDKTDYAEISDTESIADLGELSASSFSFKYSDVISCTNKIKIQEVLGHWLFRQKYQFEEFKIDLRLQPLRSEIFDKFTLTSTEDNLTTVAMILLAKNTMLTDLSGQIIAIRFPEEEEWFYFNDDENGDNLSYFVDNSTSDPSNNKYFW
ncbi:MAG: hypothetical protein A3K77_00475 [Euryarchaeota archaeon RBG_13_31_8]|nr:MAG: hypothetical protein A3K77_00475 [Euryarchaeota archaeon RBG_13_31_8]